MTDAVAFELTGFCPLHQVFDMPAPLAFYRDALSFEQLHMNDPDGFGMCFQWQAGA